MFRLDLMTIILSGNYHSFVTVMLVKLCNVLAVCLEVNKQELGKSISIVLVIFNNDQLMKAC